MSKLSHQDCVPREDYTALMRHMRHAVEVNTSLATQIRELQGQIARMQKIVDKLKQATEEVRSSDEP